MGVGPVLTPLRAARWNSPTMKRVTSLQRSRNNLRDDRSPRHAARRCLRKVFRDKSRDRAACGPVCSARGREDKYQDYLFFLAYVSTARKCRRNLVSSLDAAGLSGIKIRRTFPERQARETDHCISCESSS